MDSIIANLEAIRKRAKDIQSMYFTPPTNVFIPMRDQFFSLKDKILEIHPELKDFCCQDYELFRNGDEGYKRFANQALITDIEYFLNYFKSINAIHLPDLRISETGIFFSGEHFDALLKFHEMISKAKKEIIIIDNYFNEKVLNILTSKNKTVKCLILTQKKSISASLQVMLDSFMEQYGNLEVKYTDKFHDRFVIIDKSEFYHFGASIKDAGRKGFMFSRIEEQFIKEKLIESISNE